MTFALDEEVYSIGLLDGDLKLAKLTLAGWGAAASTVRTKTDGGRLWGRITTGNVFELWSTPTFTDATKRVAYSGTIAAAGAITFAQDNTSGISGTANVEYTLGEEQLFDVVVTYASEEDVLMLYKGARSELDTDGKLDGLDAGLESLLKKTKRKLDSMLWFRYGPEGDEEALLEADAMGRRDLSAIVAPRQLAETHAMMVVAELYQRRAAVEPESNFARMATDFARRAKQEFDILTVAFDLERDKEIDHEQGDGSYSLDRA